MTKQEILLAQKEFLFPAVFHYFKEPLVVSHAKDQYVWDVDGNQFLDFFGGIVTVSVGHCNDQVNGKVREQIDKLEHVSTVFVNEPQVALAQKLAQITPAPHSDKALRKSFFTNSGSEANETAILAARCYTGSTEIIALRHSYHGRTAGTMGVTGQSTWKLGPPQAGVIHAVNAYCYRCPFGLEYPSCEVKCAQDMEQVIRTSTSGRIAGLIAEPIQGVGGFITPPKEYFKIVTDIVRKYGGIFIADEVQTAWGRTGTKWFGIEHWNVQPDIITSAKGLGNGMPIGVTIARAEVADAMKGVTISTFGGNPVVTTAAKAVIDYIEEQNLLRNTEETGAYLRGKLLDLKDKYQLIGDVRGMGLLLAMELVEDRKSKTPATVATLQMLEAARENRIMVGRGGLYGNVLRLSPPMNIGRSDVDEFILRLDASFAKVEAALFCGRGQMTPDIRQRFPDLHPAFTRQEATVEANRCLYCADAPCAAACPTHIDVPKFIKKISSDNLRGSALTILDANILGASCARVCPVDVLCEGACVMHRFNREPIEIGRLQRHAMDAMWNHRWPLPAIPLPPNAKQLRVACIGAGPASLTCAAELARRGHKATVFEGRKHPGGLNTYGVAEYKLHAPESIREVEFIQSLGVEIRTGEQIDNARLKRIAAEYDAVFLGLGNGRMEPLGIPGEGLSGVIDALRFIADYKTAQTIPVRGRVAVVGAGNTAIDAAIASVRMGAERAIIIYRRTQREMPAFGFEYEHAKQEGVDFCWSSRPMRIVGKNGRAAGIECVRVKPNLETIAGSEFTIACDMVIPAIGQSRSTSLLAGITGIDTRKGLIEVDRETGRTGNPKFYAGGDIVNGGREVVDAVADGKRAALAMVTQAFAATGLGNSGQAHA